MRASSFAVRASLQPRALAVALLIASAGAVLAQDIGRVQQTQGLVTLVRGASSLVVESGTALQAGDVVETQRGSAAALRYVDGTQVQLGAGSRFTVSQFLRQPERPQDESFTAQLLKGAMRVITGSIAKSGPDRVRFSTNTATIGIRGTDFSVRICEDDCRVADGPQVASLRLPELAGRVGAVAGGVSAIDERGLWRVLTVSSALRPGDQIITGSTGLAILILTDGSRISLEPNSRFRLSVYQFDLAQPERGRIGMELLDGGAQITSGQLAKLRPDQYVFLAGDQVVRFKGTSIVARVVTAVSNTANDAQNAGQNAAQNTADAARNAANAGAAAAASAIRSVAAPFLNAMAAQVEALRANPPQTQQQIEAASAAAQSLANQMRTAMEQAARAASAFAGSDEVLSTVAALNVLRWQTQLTLSSSFDAGMVAAHNVPPATRIATAYALRNLHSELSVLQTSSDAMRGLSLVGLGGSDVTTLADLAFARSNYTPTDLLPIPPSTLDVEAFLRTETGGYFQNQNDAAATRLRNAAQSLADASRTALANAEAASRQIAARGQLTGQQGVQQVQQGAQRVANNAPPLPQNASPSGPPGPGYDITGARVMGPGGMQEVTQGQFNTVIVEQSGSLPRPEGGGTLVQYREQIVPPTQVRTADGQVLTGGTILREVRFDAFGRMENMNVSFVGVQFAAPGRPASALVTACADCTGLLASGFDVIPSETERGQAAVAANDGRGGGRSGFGGANPVLACGAGGSGAAPCSPGMQGGSSVAVQRGAISSQNAAGGGQSQTIEEGQVSVSEPQRVKEPTVYQGRLRFVGPAVDEDSLSLDHGRLFGAALGVSRVPVQAGATGGQTAPAGVYVHVADGAVSLAQDGQEVVIGRGETASAPAGGGAPSRVMRGVRVLAPALRDAVRLAASGQCSADEAASPPPSAVTAASAQNVRFTPSVRDLSNLRWQGDLTSKLNEKDTSQATGGGSDKGSGNRWGIGFEGNSAFDQAKGNGLQGSGKLQGPKNVVGGRHADTFAGDRLNNQGGDITLGGRPGRVGNFGRGGQVSSGDDSGLGGLIAEMLKMEGGTPTGDATKDVAELAYAQSVGTDGYAATKNMSSEQRAAYWGAEQNRQMTGGGGMTRADAEAERNRQQTGGKENPDDCASCGVSSIPIFFNQGQFGNEIRGLERAVNSQLNQAGGGATDGRGDRDAGSGSTGGVMMTRNSQVDGTVRKQATGSLNVDEALKINRLVNPGSR